jgi:hypothetical protein
MNVKRGATLWGWPLIVVPLLVSYFGGALNEIAVWKNGGQMPVLSEAYKEHIMFQADEMDYNMLVLKLGLMKGEAGKFPEEPDTVHKVADDNTKVPYLCDWIVSSNDISSPGDQITWTANQFI